MEGLIAYISGVLIIIITWLVYESIENFHKTFQKNIIKLVSTTDIINDDKAKYLMLKNDMIVESGKIIPFYNIIILMQLKTEYQRFLNFYIRKIQEKESKEIK